MGGLAQAPCLDTFTDPDMPTIRHVCDGHEYRYATESGRVTNNYGQHVAQVCICARTRDTLLVSVGAGARVIARSHRGMADSETARFAIGHTAAELPEPR